MKALVASQRLAATRPNSASIHGAVKPYGEAKVMGGTTSRTDPPCQKGRQDGYPGDFKRLGWPSERSFQEESPTGVQTFRQIMGGGLLNADKT
jgi:hypothetical protein